MKQFKAIYESFKHSVLAIPIILSVIFAGASVYEYRANEQGAGKEVVHVAPAEIIGNGSEFKGDERSPNTLVEFGDYQCPPCHFANQEITDYLKIYKGQLRLRFRNLPLTTIHSYAMRAAVIAEAAREQGLFWQVHDRFYQINSQAFTLKAINSVIGELPINWTRLKTSENSSALANVETDLHEAHALGLNSTPSFFLCRSNGEVVHLRTLDDVQNYLR